MKKSICTLIFVLVLFLSNTVFAEPLTSSQVEALNQICTVNWYYYKTEEGYNRIPLHSFDKVRFITIDPIGNKFSYSVNGGDAVAVQSPKQMDENEFVHWFIQEYYGELLPKSPEEIYGSDWSDNTIDAIRNENIRIGFTPRMVVESWGRPTKITRHIDQYIGKMEIWTYGDFPYQTAMITFVNDKLSSIDRY